MLLVTFSITQTSIFAQTNQQNSVGLSYQDCQNKIGNEMQKASESINKTKAIFLALSSSEFQSKVSGYKYVFTGIFTNMTEDQKTCGDVKLTSIVTEFSILDNSSKFVKFVEVGEDPSLTLITLVEDVFVQKCDNNCPPPSPPVTDTIQDQQPLTPLRQIASGVEPRDVMCKSGFALVLKVEDQFPACVKPQTVQKLVERGWGTSWAIAVTKNTSENNTRSNPVIDIISISGTDSPPNPGGPEIQMTLKNIGTKPITNLNARLVLNNNYTFNFKYVTESNPLAPGHLTSETQILIGAGYTTGVSHPLIVAGTVNNEPFSYTLNVSIPYTNENGITEHRK